MKYSVVNVKTVLLWSLAILLTAAHPIKTEETLKEVNEIEEVKLFLQEKKYAKQKPKLKINKKFTKFFEIPSTSTVPQYSTFEKPPKYIFYCNLIYYQ